MNGGVGGDWTSQSMISLCQSIEYFDWPCRIMYYHQLSPNCPKASVDFLLFMRHGIHPRFYLDSYLILPIIHCSPYIILHFSLHGNLVPFKVSLFMLYFIHNPHPFLPPPPLPPQCLT